MSEVSYEQTKKLSEAINENNEIITEANNLIKDMKTVKDVNDKAIDKYKKESNELIEDLDEIIDVIESCQQEDDPTLKSFESKKRTAKLNSEKSKKLLLDTLTKMEKSLQKQKDTDSKKKKGILKIGSKKNEEEDKKKKSGKESKPEPDALSTKSGAECSAVEDLEEVEEDIQSEFEDDNGDKDKDMTMDIVKTGKDEKNKDEKKKENGKDKQSKNDVSKKDKKEKTKKTDDSKSKNKDIENDNQSDGSVADEDNGAKKTPKGSKLNALKLTKGDKTKHKDKKADKNKKSDDTDVVSVTNEDSLAEDEYNMPGTSGKSESENVNDRKHDKTNKDDTESIDSKKKHSLFRTKEKKNKDKIVEDNQSLEDANAESLLPDSKKKKSKKKDKNQLDTDSMGEFASDSLAKDTDKIDKKDKKKKKDDTTSIGYKEDDLSATVTKKKDSVKDKKSEDNASVTDKKKKDGGKDKKSEDKETTDKDKKKKDGGKDKKSEDEETTDKDKKKKDKTKKSAKENDKKSETPVMNNVESDKDIGTPSLRTQDSVKSESDFYEDFESDEDEEEEKGIVVKKVVTTESKAPENHTKPTSSLMRQKVINSDEDELNNTTKLEPELLASSRFENIDEFYVVTQRFEAEEDDELDADVGDQLTILEINDDGWWMAKNAKGVKGLISVDYLRPLRDSLILQDSDKVEDIPVETITAKDIPTESSAIQDHEDTQIWDQIRQTMKEKGINDVLKAFGGLPAGFRFSSLSAWASKNPIECSMKAQLCPKLSDSDLSFKDLQIDSAENKIRARPVRIQRTVQLVKCFQMPATSDKFVLKSRHVRMCLFNGERAISNIYTMRATVNEKDLKTWMFNSKIMDSTKSLEFNEIFIRTNHTSTEICLLLEFCMLGFKSKQSNTEAETGPRKSISSNEEFSDDELIEFGAGWAKIPLYDENGQLITNRNADYELYGGTPYEEGLEVDPNNPRSATGGKFKTLMNQSKQPQVSVRISLPNKDNKDLMETLPDVIIGSTIHLTNLSYYRRILAEQLMDRRQNLTSAEPIYSPFLVSFLEMVDYPDILDAMRTIWIEKMKSLKNLDKKDYGKMNKCYQDAYMEYIYPLSKVTSLKPASLARQDTEQSRSMQIKKFLDSVKADKLSVLLSGEYSYAPLSFDEFTYKVVSKYSKALKT